MTRLFASFPQRDLPVRLGLLALAMFGIALGTALPAAAQNTRTDDATDCRSAVPRVVIPACTNLLSAPGLTALQRLPHLNNRAIAYADSKLLAEAQSDVDEMFKLGPNDPVSFISRGRLRYAQGDNERALADYNQAVTVAAPKSKYNAHLARAWFFRATKAYDAAIGDYTTAIGLEPTRPFPLAARGVTHRIKLDFVTALKDLDKAVELDPKRVFSYIDRGETHLAAKDAKKSLADFETALMLDPANQRGKQGRLQAEQALATLTPKPQAPPTAPPAVMPPVQPPRQPPGQPSPPQVSDAEKARLAQLEALLKKTRDFKKSGDLKQAIDGYTQLLKLLPDDPVLQYELADTLEDVGQKQDAINLFGKVYNGKGPRDLRAKAAVGVARVWLAIGDWLAAAQNSSHALTLDTKLDEARLVRGIAMIKLGRPSEAVTDLQMLPDLPIAAGWLAMAFVDLERPDDALKTTGAVMVKAPDLPIANAAAVRAHLAKGNLPAAEQTLARSIGLAPASADLAIAAQLVTMHKLFKSTDAPLASRRN